MNSKYVYILFLLMINLLGYSQENESKLNGTVTFVTSKNIYVKFNSTEYIKIKDSLRVFKNNKPCLLVNNKSSSSVVCTLINGCLIMKGDKVFYKILKKVVSEDKINDKGVDENDNIINDAIVVYNENKKYHYEERIRARLSVASYSNISDNSNSNHKLMSRLSINAIHINNSKVSFETYLNYRKNFIKNNSSLRDSYMNIYNMAVKYDIDTTLSITMGRKINYKASSLGPIDGLQAEKHIGKNYVGVLAGFKPDFFDFGFNFNLFQYGTYIGRQSENENHYSQTTLGFAEQRNSGQIDRRFSYFQHSSTFFRKLSLFSSAELDLYKRINNVEDNSLRLTSLYLSLRYKFNRKINTTLSYDSRKRILYYETLQTDIERLLDEDIARQGIRLRVNLKPFNYVYTGISYSKRFQNDNENKSDNIYGYTSWSKIPKIGGKIMLSYNRNSSNYLTSNIASLRYSKSFFDQRLNTDFYYRLVNYNYKSNIPKFNQNYFGGNVSYYIDRSLIVSLSGEYSTYNNVNNYRINTRIIKRFNRKRK